MFYALRSPLSALRSIPRLHVTHRNHRRRHQRIGRGPPADRIAASAQLTLFEASDRLGGVLETAHADGFLIERSADNFLTQPPAAVELCRRLGLADELLPTDDTRRRAFVVKGGKLLPIPTAFTSCRQEN